MYELAWKLGLKCFALYRAGSKLSEPLRSAKDASEEDEVDRAMQRAERKKKLIPQEVVDRWEEYSNEWEEERREVSPPSDTPWALVDSSRFPIRDMVIPGVTDGPEIGASIKTNGESHAKVAMPERSYPAAVRRPLPGMRTAVTQKARIGGHRVYLTVGVYPDGTPGEIFLTVDKDGTMLNSFVSAFAIAISQALQHGVPLNRIIEGHLFSHSEPNGIISGDARIKTCSSLPDYVARFLGVYFGGRDDLASVPPVEDVPVVSRLATVGSYVPAATVSGTIQPLTRTEPGRVVYEGNPCPNCQRLTLIRTGACLFCTSCMNSTGGCG